MESQEIARKMLITLRSKKVKDSEELINKFQTDKINQFIAMNRKQEIQDEQKTKAQAKRKNSFLRRDTEVQKALKVTIGTMGRMSTELNRALEGVPDADQIRLEPAIKNFIEQVNERSELQENLW